MVNAWSLAASILGGTFDEEYPIVKDDAYYEKLQKEIEESGGYEWTPGSPWPPEVPDDQYTQAFDHLIDTSVAVSYTHLTLPTSV